jgi:xylulokinase
MRDAILGIDIGTSATKAILYDLDGKEITSASQSYPLSTPQPGWVEQDTEEVWQALILVLKTIVDQSNGCRVLSLAIAAQAGSIIPTDLKGDPVYPMITWLDNRSQELTRQWQADGTAATIRRLSGWQPFFGLPLPSIGWLKQELPEIHSAAKRFLGPADFFVHRLTGNFATDLSASSEMLLVDIKTGEWSEELCAIGGVDARNQAAIDWAGRKVGEVTFEASRLTGLPVGTPVIAGGNDQPCAGLGMGMTTPGKVMLSTGTAWVIMSVVDADSTEAIPEWVNLYFHAVPGKRLGGQLVGGFGATVDWWIRQIYQQTGEPGSQDPGPLYDELNKAVQSSPPGSKGLLFFPLSGPSQIVGAVPGGGFSGMELVHTRSDMSRAVLEGCAFEVRWALDELRASGIPVNELWLAGGANRSPVWPQILADITGIPLTIAGDTDWAALGGAALAGWGAGAFSTLEDGITRLQPATQQLMPNPALADLYAHHLAEYKRQSHSINSAKNSRQ